MQLHDENGGIQVGVPIYDLRDEQSALEQHSKLEMPKKYKILGGRVVVRDPKQVTGITIHQTAVPYSVVQSQINAAGGDRSLALARRAMRIACHVMAFRDGFISWPNPLRWYIYHGNGFNSYELGIEIDGRYPGLIGGDTWDHKPATVVTDKLVATARAGIELLVGEGRKLGMPIEKIHAHRQSSATRRSDPGEELWQRVVLEHAVPVLGLETEPALSIGDGRPIPKEWDTDGVGAY